MEQKTRKAFHTPCKVLMGHLLEAFHTIEDEEARHDYSFTLLSRLIFAFFLQRKGLLDGNQHYLQQQLQKCESEQVPFPTFLAQLFYAGLGTPTGELPGPLRHLLGDVPYLGGDLFRPHAVEQHYMQHIGQVAPPIPHLIFEEFFSLCERFDWDLEEEKEIGGQEGVITPLILSHLIEHSLPDRKGTGSYYTPIDICNYIVQQTCEPCILHCFGEITGRQYDTVDALLTALDARDCALLLLVILPTVSILDPACGAGDFLIVGLNKMVSIYQYIIQRAEQLHHPVLDNWLEEFGEQHPCRIFALGKRVSARNLFGVDIQRSPLDMTKLRLALGLLSSIKITREIEPLPNVGYALPRGNSLVGFDKLTETEMARLTSLFPQYKELVDVKNALVRRYTSAIGNPILLETLRTEIEDCRRAVYPYLDRVLWEKVTKRGAMMEEKIWDSEKGRIGTRKRPFTLEDLVSLGTFHWVFDMEIMNRPWWERLDGGEAQVIQTQGKWKVQFGPQVLPSIA